MKSHVISTMHGLEWKAKDPQEQVRQRRLRRKLNPAASLALDKMGHRSRTYARHLMNRTANHNKVT